jgi:FAD binding domain
VGMELVDQCRSGRVFLVGDAAHLNPPFGGHGLNTGIGDAVDLGWKLAAVLAGWGAPGLLDSYEAERGPLHRRVIDEAAANMATLAPELLADGLDRAGPEGDRARSAAARRIIETKRAEYFSSDLVLGHRYEDSPVLQALPPALAPGPWASCAAPGRRLPHLWVSPQVSTLDLVTGDHVILTADGELGARAARAAEAAGLPATVTAVEQAVMRRLGAELLVVRPDQVVSAVWPPPATGHFERHGVIDSLDTTMTMLCDRPRSGRTEEAR